MTLIPRFLAWFCLLGAILFAVPFVVFRLPNHDILAITGIVLAVIGLLFTIPWGRAFGSHRDKAAR